MTRLGRLGVVLAGTAVLALAAPATAFAQEPAPEPPTANCGFLSAVVCQVPVNIGPIGPFEFNFPGGIFGPPPAAAA